MVDSERGRVGFARGHGLQRNISAGTTVKIDVFQSFRAFPILRCNFEHHVVLIQLRVDDGNFRLAECAVEG